jgi:hypothetical protein
VNGDLTESFPIHNGGKQGDPLFPLIFITACDGMFAMLESNPDFVGIPTPDSSTEFQHSGYADYTVIDIGCESDIALVERVLRIFCFASGQEVKPVKSFVMWLGQKRRLYNEIHRCLVLPHDTGVRYLVVKVGTKVTQDDYLPSLLQSVESTKLDWQTRGCSIFGRTLIYNSCLLGKIWFNATQALASNKFEQKFQVRFDTYLRQGKKRSNINHATRVLPKEMGGMG